jgi:hypothetical protein
MLVKIYGPSPVKAGAYSPPECIGAVKKVVESKTD